ncbi:MAG: GNAT family N-acetyltransferase [Candidatus Heimdallarchaeota archaeon]
MIKEIKDPEIFKQAAKLAEICFHEQTIEENIKFYNRLKELYLLGFFENNELLATAGTLDFQMFVRNQILSCAGVAIVMTDPIHRKKGYIRKLMVEILQKKFEEGYDITTLWPFNHKFYQKFGYENCEKAITYKFSPSDLKSSLKIEESVNIREIKDEKDYILLNQIAHSAQNKYTRIIGKLDAWILRDSSEKFKFYIFERKNDPVGYISFKFRKSKKEEWVTDITIVDLAYIDVKTKHSVFAFLRNFESDISNILINLPYEEEILSFLNDIKDEHKFAQWPPMSRILNVKSTIEKLSFPITTNSILYAEIKDEVIEENSGIWKFKIRDGKCSTQKIPKSESEENKVLKFKIGEFTQLVVGVIGIKNLFESELENVPKEWRKNDIFPTQPCKIGVWF